MARSLYNQVLINQSAITAKRWNAEENLFVLLYSLIRSLEPKIIVETGVANGITTNAIMSALHKSSKQGELHSFDVLPETRNAYSGPGNWNFHLLSTKNTARNIKGIASKFSKVDIWVHDSDHGYRWQKFEYLLALASLCDNGILISDDIDASSAWGELAKTHFRKSFIIFDSRKFIGIAFK
jgi:predicted O-methyltransferase YrrM